MVFYIPRAAQYQTSTTLPDRAKEEVADQLFEARSKLQSERTGMVISAALVTFFCLGAIAAGATLVALRHNINFIGGGAGALVGGVGGIIASGLLYFLTKPNFDDADRKRLESLIKNPATDANVAYQAFYLHQSKVSTDQAWDLLMRIFKGEIAINPQFFRLMEDESAALDKADRKGLSPFLDKLIQNRQDYYIQELVKAVTKNDVLKARYGRAYVQILEKLGPFMTELPENVTPGELRYFRNIKNLKIVPVGYQDLAHLPSELKTLGINARYLEGENREMNLPASVKDLTILGAASSTEILSILNNVKQLNRLKIQLPAGISTADAKAVCIRAATATSNKVTVEFDRRYRAVELADITSVFQSWRQEDSYDKNIITFYR